MESFTNVTPKQLRRAADVKERIETLQAELNQLLAAAAPVPAAPEAPGRKKISAAGIARIRAAQRARWAAVRGASARATPGRKRKFSAAGRAKLAALARARWAKAKASGKSTL